MALTIEQTQKSAAKRKAKVAAAPAANKATAKKAAPAATQAKAKRAKASVRKTVKPWSQASTTMDAAGLQKWMDVVIDKVFERPMPAFIDKADVKKRSEVLVDLVEKGVEIGQERVQQIRQKNPVLNELIDVAQKQLKKAQGYINKK